MPRYYTREMMDMFNVSRKQLRYYEDKGLLRNVPRNEDNGYRYYTIEHVKQMIAIMGMKDLNLPSDKIKDILYADSISDVKEVMQHKLDDAKKDVAFSMGQYIKVMEMYNSIMEGILYNSSPEYQSDVNGNLGMYEVVTVPPRDVISMSYMETFQDPDSIFIKQLAEIQSLSKSVDVYDMLNATFIFYDHFADMVSTLSRLAIISVGDYVPNKHSATICLMDWNIGYRTTTNKRFLKWMGVVADERKRKISSPKYEVNKFTDYYNECLRCLRLTDKRGAQKYISDNLTNKSAITIIIIIIIHLKIIILY